MTQPAAQPALIAVHGFMYDPKDKGGSNDPQGFFDDMSGIAGRPVTGYAWYSAPFGLRVERPLHSVYQTARSWLSAWVKGQLDPYKLAWQLAEKAAGGFADLVMEQEGPVDVLAHSLGTRVVLRALHQIPPGKIRRVVFFDGAELVKNVWDELVAVGEAEQILNIAVRKDHVLSLLGCRFSGDGFGECIGQKGVPGAPAYWKDLFLDNPLVIQLARKNRGWTLRGDAPGDFLDHSTSYEFPGNTDLVRAWLGGDDLADLVGPR